MRNNTQHRIQVTLKQNAINPAKPSITSHSSQLFTYSNYNQSLVFRDLSPHNNI